MRGSPRITTARTRWRGRFLHLLFLVRAHGSINKLFSIEGGSQENLIEGGAASIAQRVADELGDAVRLNAPARSITQRNDHVLVDAGELAVSARHALVSVPPALALEIAFDPALPDDRVELYRNAVAGPEAKTLVVYDEPFWRPRPPPKSSFVREHRSGMRGRPARLVTA